MRVPGIKSARRLTRWIKGRLFQGALILGYHRIAQERHDPFSICVSPEHFAEQLEVLHRLTHPVSLGQMIREAKAGTLSSRSVAVTFDDGYLDILVNAMPLLDRYEIPATVFIPTGFIGKELWWDELERIIADQKATPDRFASFQDNLLNEWDVGSLNKKNKRKRYTEMNDDQWMMSLYEKLLPLSHKKRELALDRLRVWSQSRMDNSSLRRVVTEEELADLATSEWIDIGAHSVTHPKLSELTAEDQYWEIEQSKSHLEKLLGHPISFFSYPNGSRSSLIEKIVREAGFTGACGSYNDLTRATSNLFHLPRFWVADQDGASFSRWLERWLKL